MNYIALAPDEIIEKTITALHANNMEAEVVATKEEARQKALSLLPPQAEVMTMTSVTLDETGILAAIEESSQLDMVKKKLAQMDRATQSREMQRIGAAPEYAIGSVHAVTQDGKVLVASNTGSQLPAYVYGADHVIWVVGTQKIVENVEAGMKRIYEYVLPKEDARAQQAYGQGSNVSKLLIVNKEVKPNRIHLIFVKELLGY